MLGLTDHLPDRMMGAGDLFTSSRQDRVCISSPPTAPGFDALTHLEALDGLPRVANQARQAGVGGWVVAGFEPQDWDRTRQAAGVTAGVLALGVHPWLATAHGPDRATALLDAADPPVVGEIGLDHLHADSARDRATQRRVLRAQLAWAREHDRPVILHAVRAVPEVLHVIDQDGLGPAGGMLHGVHTGPQLSLRAVDLGLHLSIGPLLLGRSPHKIVDTLRQAPRDRIVLETDAPEQPFAGHERPTPAQLVHIAGAVARVWQVDAREVLVRTGRTARALFRAADPRRDRG